MTKKVDILAFAAHPDDVELAASGTLLAHKALGYRIGIVDLTQGELGTRGSSDIRKLEAEESSKILNLDYRHNLHLKDGFFEINEESIRKVVTEIRKTKPTIVLANALSDRHPDHGQAALLVAKAFYLSGLNKIETFVDNKKQEAFRPKLLLHYIQDHYSKPDLVIDISKYMSTKLASINAFSSQFYQGKQDDEEPITPISGKDFQLFLSSRARQFGRIIGAEFGEGFNSPNPISINNLLELS